MKKIIVTGATGLIGKECCLRLIERGYHVTIFSRDPDAARQKVHTAHEFIAWDAVEDGPWASALDGAHGVIHLAGASLTGKRWSPDYKQEIYRSRIIGTRGLVQAMRVAGNKPQVFVCSSAVGYYGFRDATVLDEYADPGQDFIARMCVDWEAEALGAQVSGIRTVVARTGIVLATNDGVLPQIVGLFKRRMGGFTMPGIQWFPWIHIDDIVGLLLFALENDRISGPLNGTAPEPQTNQAFANTVGRVYGSASWLPVPGIVLKLLIGEVADTLIHGQRAVPQKAQEAGYQFKFLTAENALQDLLQRT